MEDFCNVSFATTEQHIDSREYRIKRDVADLQILQKFFNRYDPFPQTDNIMSIFSGIIGSNSVNCHEAYEEGKKSLQAIVGMNFGSVKFKRKNKVLSLQTVQSSVKVNGDIIAIDPLLLFQRISLTIDSKKDMETYLQYELAPFPLSLFTENGLRKNVKSQLYELFVSVNGPTHSDGIVHVVDGGFLLHKGMDPKEKERLLKLYEEVDSDDISDTYETDSDESYRPSNDDSASEDGRSDEENVRRPMEVEEPESPEVYYL
ncbi:unnamed protein product [Brassicogethes aeneus]|uniref:Uncharacterized protein n=1 Tax=Brassicogethes aeneus TaxID=1431903 RepID=A0A9P0FK45_BRAAE|nr:unnamed protein product [Brassicogethes aeneus]